MTTIGDEKALLIREEWNNKKYIIDINSYITPTTLNFFDNGGCYGQFAAVCKISDELYEGVRDPLGIGKLFYCRDEQGKLHFAPRFSELFQYKCRIFSLPPGYRVKIHSGGVDKVRSLMSSPQEESWELKSFQADFNSRIDLVFKTLRKKEESGWKIFIALSGGLDSTIIASKSAEYLKSPVACTLDLGKSEDSEKSEKIAGHIGIEHKVFKTTREDILDALEEAPFSCQDFRDFNVHCAALNILLARNIKAIIDSSEDIDREKVIILTGDLMNEFTCDYAGEVIDGKEYYKLPRVGKKQLQQYLIGGLDTSDREISPFASYGLLCIQPYAVLWDLYSTLPESVLEKDDPKKYLNSFQVDRTIKDFIPKVKLRAQVGSRENMGILGLCHSLGMSDKSFHKSLLDIGGDPQGKIPLFVGRYDVEKMNG
jgi:hypothetical protein